MGFLKELGYHWEFLMQALFTPKAKFSTDQIPDLTGRVVVVTGTAFQTPLHHDIAS